MAPRRHERRVVWGRQKIWFDLTRGSVFTKSRMRPWRPTSSARHERFLRSAKVRVSGASQAAQGRQSPLIVRFEGAGCTRQAARFPDRRTPAAHPAGPRAPGAAPTASPCGRHLAGPECPRAARCGAVAVRAWGALPWVAAAGRLGRLEWPSIAVTDKLPSSARSSHMRRVPVLAYRCRASSS